MVFDDGISIKTSDPTDEFSETTAQPTELPGTFCPISASEPSLRFPRPQGNIRLARWISSSDPEIMRVATAPSQEETVGLSDSTYELVATDSESQDGYITESAASSEYGSGGNTQDNMYDDGDCVELAKFGQDTSGPAPVVDSTRATASVNDSQDENEAEDDDFVITHPSAADDQQDSPLDLHDPVFGHLEVDRSHVLTHSDSLQSSIEYTEQGLQIPSTKHSIDDESRLKVANPLRLRLLRLVKEPIHPEQSSTDDDLEQKQIKAANTHGLLPVASVATYKAKVEMWVHPMAVIFCLAIVLVQVAVLGFSSYSNFRMSATTPISVPEIPSASAITVALTSTKTIRVPATPTHTSTLTYIPPVSRGASSGSGFGSISNSEVAIFSVEVTANHGVLVKIPSGTKTSWLAKDSISIEVCRAQERLKTKLLSIDDGILIELSKHDIYGLLNISIITTRRPKINESFVVDLGSSLLMNFRYRGSRLANDLFNRTSPGFPWEGVSHGVSYAQARVTEMIGLSNAAASEAARVVWSRATLGNFTANKVNQMSRNVRGRLAREMAKVEELQDELAVTVLRAQISSKLWWLALQNKRDEHTKYETKAKSYLEHRRDEAGKARARRTNTVGRRVTDRREATCLSSPSFLRRRRWQCKNQKE